MAATTEKVLSLVETGNWLQALRKNKRLTNPALWKQLQQFVVMLMGITPFLRYMFPQYALLLDPVFLGLVEGGLGSIATYFQYATTGELGRS